MSSLFCIDFVCFACAQLPLRDTNIRQKLLQFDDNVFCESESFAELLITGPRGEVTMDAHGDAIETPSLSVSSLGASPVA